MIQIRIIKVVVGSSRAFPTPSRRHPCSPVPPVSGSTSEAGSSGSLWMLWGVGRCWTVVAGPGPAEKVRNESVIQSVQLMFVIIQLGSVQLSSSRLSRLSSVFKVQGQGFVSFTEQRPEAGSGRKGQADALTMRAAVLDTIVKSEAGRGRRCRRRRRRSSPLL